MLQMLVLCFRFLSNPVMQSKNSLLVGCAFLGALELSPDATIEYEAPVVVESFGVLRRVLVDFDKALDELFVNRADAVYFALALGLLVPAPLIGRQKREDDE
ncbi:hypothetical protein LTR08_007889 [Meristemomyces frigidus]|nr:hypothetical protein LTR08_007889 [Meristemomyces frigidus]